MAQKVVIKAEKREQSGKGFARRLRAEGKIPITLYGGGKDAVSIAADLSELAAILRSDTGANTIFSLDLAGEKGDVMFQDRQIDPVKGRLLHADLRRLKKGEKIEVTVPVHLIGDPVGTTQDDGVLQQPIREIKVLCEPADIPEFFELNVEHLALGESVHVSDIKAGDEVEIHEDPETVIASVVLVKEELEELGPEEGTEPEIVGEEGEEGEAAAEGEDADAKE
jgi:large subunit ribosomal protein L25